MKDCYFYHLLLDRYLFFCVKINSNRVFFLTLEIFRKNKRFCSNYFPTVTIHYFKDTSLFLP